MMKNENQPFPPGTSSCAYEDCPAAQAQALTLFKFQYELNVYKTRELAWQLYCKIYDIFH